MSERPQRVLVLCTGNSCRSIMAEALINALGSGRFEAVSAGSHPVGQVHPRALETLRRHDIALGHVVSESWDVYVDHAFDYVITVCDAAAVEPCPLFPGECRRMHWSTPDPAAVTGSDQEADAAFEGAFTQLRCHIENELFSPSGNASRA